MQAIARVNRVYLDKPAGLVVDYLGIAAAEVIDELIKISKVIVESDDEKQNMGLTDFEYAFYTAVANNDSAKQLMQHEQLRDTPLCLRKKSARTLLLIGLTRKA